MANSNKLSVEKALEKIRRDDQLKSKGQRRDEKTEELNEEIRRMRAQRQRLDQTPLKRK